MSESDDTDILLLIPPDFFISSAEEKLRKQQELQTHRSYNCQPAKDSFNDTISNALRDFSYDDEDCVLDPFNDIMEALHDCDKDGATAVDAILMPPPTAAYQYLPTRCKAELNHINTRLATLEQEHFAAPSDISTISNCTVRTQHGTNGQKPQKREVQVGFIHSTPKNQQQHHPQLLQKAGPDDGVLSEIDNFLEDRNYGTHWNPNKNGQHHSDDYQRFCPQQEQMLEKHASSMPNALNRNSSEKFDHCAERSQVLKDQPNLISLSEIWGKDGNLATTVSGVAGAPNATLKEEQLRRQHLEKTVRTLQSRLLEYQQRLSVAIEVDRSKDAALARAQTEMNSTNQDLRQLRESVFQFQTEQQQYNRKLETLQHELAQAVNMASKFQSKNEKLENEIASISRKSSECSNTFEKQIGELELKLKCSQTSEESAISELNKFKDKHVKVEYQNEKLKTRCDELEKESSTLRQQKELLQDYHQKQKNRADSLETQKKSMQETLGNLTQNEMTLKKKLETQQKSLKSHYQQQLENVVAQKLKEFQEQLDKTEESFRAEARERERLIAERAVKQLELINEKNELELNLMQEKHNEEVELYRIQLANASKKIDDLELKLNALRSKRADIAEKLHDVMETQWQKALEILTSPNQSRQNENTINDAETSDCVDNQSKSNVHPKTPKTSKYINESTPPPPPMDRLQAYIELLLSKSPSDFDKLDEILALSTNSKYNASKDRSAKRGNSAKPPWKA